MLGHERELVLLDIRLHELSDLVDRFVVVEADKTFPGEPKPWVLEPVMDRFAEFADRIEYLKITMPNNSAWGRQRHQRNACVRNVKMEPDALVLISDIDEIPRSTDIAGVEPPFFCVHKLYCYRLNIQRYKPSDRSGGTVGVRRNTIETADKSRWTLLRESAGERLSYCGWHWSYLGTASQIADKIRMLSQTSCNKPEWTAQEHIENAIRRGTDIYDKDTHGYKVVPVDETYPKYVLDNLDKFAPLIAEMPTDTDAAAQDLQISQKIS